MIERASMDYQWIAEEGTIGSEEPGVSKRGYRLGQEDRSCGGQTLAFNIAIS